MIIAGAGEFLEMAQNKVVVDVRSPLEYASGHIPGAFNVPLFNNEERKIVGTLYKQVGRDEAIHKGLELVGPKLSKIVKAALVLSKEKEVLLHCWRGGLRSKNMAFLLELAGFKVTLLEGGYKSYRKFIRSQLETHNNLVVLGGKTGSGKTDILEYIASEDQQVLRLEEIAHHKGSAFGDLGQADQPSNEQFENNLYNALMETDPDRITWVEDESRGIGRVSIPEPLFSIMRNTEVIFLDVPKSERVRRLVKEYAGFSKERLSAAIVRITKKLGGLNSKRALEALENNDFETVADILLIYYDKAYLKGLSVRDEVYINRLSVETDDPEKNALLALEFFKNKVAYKYRKKVKIRTL